MIGAIAGDIVGSVYEHANIRTTDFPLISETSTFTDDTVMTLALADALLHGRDFAENFRRFYAWYPRAGYGYMFKTWAKDPTRPAYGSYGNGSAMRVAPAAWVAATEEEVIDLAARTAVVSHDHPEGVKGAVAVALATYLARKGASKQKILDRVVAVTAYDLDFSLDDIRADYIFDATCQGSVPQALVAFREGGDFEDSIRLAISIGGDSDTIACMTGAIAAAHFGGVPEALAAEVRNRLDERLRGVLDLFEARFVA